MVLDAYARLALLVTIGFAVAIGFWLARRASGRGTRFGAEPELHHWMIVGDDLGLQYRTAGREATLSGRYHDVPVQLQARWRPADPRYDWTPLARLGPTSWIVSTRIWCGFPLRAVPAGLKLWSQNPLSKLADALLRDGEIELQDAEFDAAFIVHGDDPDAVARALTPVARAGLLRLRGAGVLTVDEQGIALVVPDLVRDGARLEDLVVRVTDVWRELTRAA